MATNEKILPKFSRAIKKIQNKWKHVILFLGTPTGFYLDLCSNIIKNEGKISIVGENWISNDIQKEYSKLLTEFIK